MPADVRRLARVSVLCLAVYWPLFVVAFHIPIPPQPPSTSVVPPDKRVHIVGYAVLAFLVGWVTWPCGKPPADRRAADLLLRAGVLGALIVLHGWLDEVTQPWTGRAFEWPDLMADALGAAVGIAVLFGLATRRQLAWVAEHG